MAKKTLDFTAVWNDTISMLTQHKEAAAAIAGVFIFLPAWLFAYYIGQPMVEGAADLDQQMEITLAFYNDNWLAVSATGLLTSFGTLAYYLVLVRKDLASLGEVLIKALMLFPIFFVVNLITGILTALGVIAFIIGAFYLLGRFSAVAGVVAAESERGIMGSIQYGWKLTENVGWLAFLMIFIVSIVGGVITWVIGLVFGLIFKFIGGDIAGLLNAGVASLLNAVISIVVATLVIAIYRHLKPQVDGNTANATLNQE